VVVVDLGPAIPAALAVALSFALGLEQYFRGSDEARIEASLLVFGQHPAIRRLFVPDVIAGFPRI